MKRDTRIFVWLDNDEWTALIRQADKDLRHPREQARYIIRRALLGGSDKPTTDSAMIATPQREAVHA